MGITSGGKTTVPFGTLYIIVNVTAAFYFSSLCHHNLTKDDNKAERARIILNTIVHLTSSLIMVMQLSASTIWTSSFDITQHNNI